MPSQISFPRIIGVGRVMDVIYSNAGGLIPTLLKAASTTESHVLGCDTVISVVMTQKPLSSLQQISVLSRRALSLSGADLEHRELGLEILQHVV